MFAKENYSKDMIAKLEAVESVANFGRGVQCVKTIIHYLKLDKYDEAQRVYGWDGDKTRSYKDVEKVLVEIFGCRLHGKVNCDNWVCGGNPI